MENIKSFYEFNKIDESFYMPDGTPIPVDHNHVPIARTEIGKIEENEAPRKFGCLMLNFDDTGWEEEIENMIDKDDLFVEEEGHGFETEPHCTVLYGFHDDKFSLDKCINMIKPVEKIKVSSGKISIFENEKFDVLKYDIDSEDLIELNKNFADNFEFTTDYPEYHAHCTIAYLKPGCGSKYVKECEKTFKPSAFKYSYGHGDKVYLYKKMIED
jgi:hypothetical protein